MLFDLLFLGLCLAFAVAGGFSGFLTQVVHLGALLGAWAAARFVAPLVTGLVARHVGMPRLLVLGIGSLVLGTLTFAVLALLGRALVRRLRRGERPKPWERAGGVLFGALKAGAILYLATALVVLVDRVLPVRLTPTGSEVAALARRYNPLARLPLPLETLERALRRVAAARRGASADPVARALAADPTVGAAAVDPRLKQALERGDYVELMRHDVVLELLADPKLRQRLEHVGVGATRRE